MRRKELRMRIRILLAACAAISAILACRTASAAGYTDMIKLKSGKLISRCRVEGEDIDKVTYRDETSTQAKTVPQKEVDYVTFSDAPRELRNARRKFAAGNSYVEAIRDYQEALKARNVRMFWLGPECLYHIAESYLRLVPPRLKLAAETLSKLNKDYPNNKYMAKAQTTLADLYFKRSEFDKALEEFERIESATGADGEPRYEPVVHYNAAMGCVRCLVSLKRRDKALLKLKSVEIKARELGPSKDYEVKVQYVLIHIGNGEFEKAKKAATAVIRKAKYDYKNMPRSERAKGLRPLRSALAQCFNALGDAYMGAANAKDNYMEALVNYLYVVTLFDDSPEEHAKALLKAGLCYRQIKNELKAQLMWKELKQRYPGSAAARQIPRPK